jgi:hypothetical protein
VKVEERNLAGPGRPHDVDDGVEGRERDRHVGRMGGDAVL